MGTNTSADQKTPYEGKVFRTLKLDINFPFQPYGVQNAMMNTITRTLMNKQHCLIESPTGTGKTLVLLCSSLAWQKKSKSIHQPFLSDNLRKEQYLERQRKLAEKPCTCGRRENPQSELDALKEGKGKKESCCKALDDDDDIEWSDDENESVLKKIKTDNPKESLALAESPYFKNKPAPKAHVDPDVIVLDDSDDEGCEVLTEDSKLTLSNSDKDKISSPISEVKKDTFWSNPKYKSKPDIEVDSEVQTDFDQDKKPKCKACLAIDAETAFADVLGDEGSVDGEGFISSKIKTRVPRIYYGTRTHKQITQVVRELNKTPYNKDLKMCILSSRERTCVNEAVKDQPNRNDLCQELIKNKKANMDKSKKAACDTCPYYSDSTTISQLFTLINDEFTDTAWDIEDAAKFGREHSSCPYFGVRSLQQSADITFCPYNYLLDPTIRRTLDINLSNSIVIFDEAHNIEDICRESASFNVDSKQLEDVLSTINITIGNYLQGSKVWDAYTAFKHKILDILAYLRKFTFNDATKDSGEERKSVPQSDIMNQLNEANLGPEELTKFKESLKAIKGDEEDGASNAADPQTPALSFHQMSILTQLAITLEFMYSNNKRFLNDFRLVIAKYLERDFNRFKPGNRGNQTVSAEKAHIWRFSLLCMNPEISFEKIHKSAWSVIVASGTLSPLDSLKTELGCEFKNVHEGAHVIQGDRVFATILSAGPKNVDLNCAFANSLRLDFQDEVGSIILDVCKTVPNGILCFFPSYERMENLYQRWMTKGLMSQISKKKKLFREKKNLTASEFELELTKYHQQAKMKGAILFAVFRGKVSEGIDFADMAARAVITIGIPYPNFKEVTVGLKQEYNDIARRQKPSLMPGRDWYATQAFRALNQALGRCIRHKQDWGAIIMIDSRLRQSNSSNNISRWLRRVLCPATEYSVIYDCLTNFVASRSNEQ